MTSLNPYTGEAKGYVILAWASKGLREQIARLVGELQKELPGTLWPAPPEQLHFTLCEIFQPLVDYGTDKDDLFEDRRAAYEEVPDGIIAAMPKFGVRINAIEASPSAIIVRGDDPSQFNAIRAQLVEQMGLPEGTKQPPDIVHCSVARYAKVLELEEVQRVMSRHEIDFVEEFTEFQLLRFTEMPLSEYEVLRTYRLA